MCFARLRYLRTTLLALVAAVITATAAFGVTIYDKSVPLLEPATFWPSNASLGVGMVTLSRALPLPRGTGPVFAELPSGARQITFTLSPAFGAQLTYGMEGRTLNSTTPLQWRRNILRQASEVAGFRIRGKPLSLFLHVGNTGTVHLTFNYRVRPTGAKAANPFQPLYDSAFVLPTAAEVPVPAPFALLVIALSGLTFVGWRRKDRPAS